jgi:hypothetical protein
MPRLVLPLSLALSLALAACGAPPATKPVAHPVQRGAAYARILQHEAQAAKVTHPPACPPGGWHTYSGTVIPCPKS